MEVQAGRLHLHRLDLARLGGERDAYTLGVDTPEGDLDFSYAREAMDACGLVAAAERFVLGRGAILGALEGKLATARTPREREHFRHLGELRVRQFAAVEQALVDWREMESE